MEESPYLSPSKAKALSTSRVSPLKMRSSKKQVSDISTESQDSKRSTIISTLMKSTASIIQISKENDKVFCFNKAKNEYFRNPLYIHEDKLGDFDQYYVELGVLGEGTSSIVKKYRNTLDNHVYAVKIMRTTEHELITQAKNEFNNLKFLNCELIVKVYEMFVNKIKGRVIIVMEYIAEMENLNKIVAVKGPMSEDAARGVFRMLLQGIHEMHINGICHRDLKPGNVIMNDNMLNIIDFNISKRVVNFHKYDHSIKKRNILMMSNVGTLEYMAPEMLQGFSEYSEQVDIWAAGIVLYFILSGETPFRAENTSDIMRNITTSSFKFNGKSWESVSDECKEYIKEFLNVDPESRPTAIDALRHDWMRKDLLKRPRKKISFGSVCFNNFKGVEKDFLTDLSEDRIANRNSKGKRGKSVLGAKKNENL